MRRSGLAAWSSQAAQAQAGRCGAARPDAGPWGPARPGPRGQHRPKTNKKVKICQASGPRRDRSGERCLSRWSISSFSALSPWSLFFGNIGREKGSRPGGRRGATTTLQRCRTHLRLRLKIALVFDPVFLSIWVRFYPPIWLQNRPKICSKIDVFLDRYLDLILKRF